MNGKISIIVPVYNAENTLDRCISALIGQTYENIEIILINDGSKDGSLEICRRYALEDPRVMVIDKPNGGVSSARNAGMDKAKGAFLMFCDSDDWAEPEWCEELLSNYEDDCLVMCGHYIEGEQNYVPREIRATTKRDRYDRRDFRRLKLCSFNAPWNKIFSRKVINSNGLRFDEHFSNGEDFLFNLQYLNCISGDIVFLSKCVFHYNWPDSNSLSVKVPKDYFSQCCMMTESILKQCNALGIENEHEMQGIITDRHNEFMKIILFVIYDTKCPVFQKLKRLRAVMSSSEYQMCAKKAFISMNRVYSWLARRKNGAGIWLWHILRDKWRK